MLQDDYKDAYPTWVEVVTPGPNPAHRGRAKAGSSTTSISDVLGWRVDIKNADGIKRALAEAFPIKVVNGKNCVEVKKGGFRSQAAQAGTFAVTGAQKSLYERVRTVVEQIKPLLASIRPLTSSPDQEDIDAVKSLIGPELDELVEQLGTEGGPPIARIDHLLHLLIGYEHDEGWWSKFLAKFHKKSNDSKGHIYDLGSALGITDDNVNTIQEEMTLTEFTTILNYTDMIVMTWNANRDAFSYKPDQAFLGTQAVQIERTLTCVSESVNEVTFALDSVFIGPAERATIIVPKGEFEGGTLAELLSWIDDVAARGFDQINVSGKYGVGNALKPALEKVCHAVDSVLKADIKIPGFTHNRVENAFKALQFNLGNALYYAESIPAPDITALAVDAARMPIRAEALPPPPPPPPIEDKPPDSPRKSK